MSKNKPVILQVAAKAAIVSPSNKVLILREAQTDKNNTKVGQYGLVGGRLNPGETFNDGLIREVSEETGLKVKVHRPLYIGEWHPVINGVEHQIIAIFVLCKSQSERLKLSKEHDDYIWINPADRKKYPMMEPDCFVVDLLKNIQRG